ncbi:MAG: dephospho-CoA kinase [Acidimicrobiales bacterium]
MIAIGLTGGIGSGKSTVASMLVERGAVLIDADVLAREVVEPGRKAFAEVRERFGDGVLAPDGSLDRQALAAIVFADEVARADLNAIVHPEVGREMFERISHEAGTDHVVILDVPLLAEGGRDRYPVAGVLVVDCPVDLAIDRLVAQREMDRADAERRVAAQSSREDRLRVADFIIMNMGSMDELRDMVARAWAWIEGLRSQAGSAP